MSDQGVSIDVTADVDGKQTALLRFNCFDIEKSYIYGPENPELTTPGRVGGGMGVHCRMDPITDGNPIGWTIRTLGQKLPKMLDRAGYKDIAAATDLATVRARPARRGGLRQRNVHLQAEHGQAQPRHGHVRSRQHPVRPRDAAAEER